MKIKLLSGAELEYFQTLRFEVLSRGASKAIVAGGCLRDKLLGRPVSDIDIFHEGEIQDAEGLQKLNVEELEVEYQRAIKIFEDSSSDTPVQYIQVKDIQDRLANFSLGLSQVYIDDAGLVLPLNFLDAVEKQELRFALWVSDSYREKIKAKYPDFEVNYSLTRG